MPFQPNYSYVSQPAVNNDVKHHRTESHSFRINSANYDSQDNVLKIVLTMVRDGVTVGSYNL